MHITHVNLARGFRGGERQTELLIKTLAEQSHNDLSQTLVCRRDSPMRQHLHGVTKLTFQTADHQLAGHFHLGDTQLVHAHDAKGVHWAYLHYRLKGTPYLITRRVDAPVRKKWFNQQSYSHASARVALSQVIKHLLEDSQWGNVTLIPSAYSRLTPKLEAANSFREDFRDKFLVGHAGAVVDSHKGQRVLLKAAQMLEHQAPDIHFIFLGDGKDAEALKAESSSLGNVSWLGFKSDIANYLAGLDIFAFPSRNEGLGSVILDVMQLGIPVIATDVGGIPDIVKHEHTGLLIPSSDAESLAKGIIRLREDPALRQQLAQEATEHLDQYSPQSMAASYWHLYQSIVN
ncbi:glycosyltransferase family 4 protein [Halomonas janggokensis]|jgi:glycosyltransferase involved in cell wall biosynthesis|uniref:Glycosyltransferase family 4 protein n=1 Tax=Vreelandella janggokensis TaxID=370767 RepID=A0ABT4IXF2_9GAMM|nr:MULTISPECIES: glycosyltransferase family 4 protein [Halomonas]MCW4150939.1 glycosyltransferase family 4 protein [Halomonas sp. 18H]MCZ0927664.1 glycosyltransferase family 4 protein [Halomonas janggokensis]MCZ0930172.1 glycosyltransferase family 4 protein [Halomonas janggokensis]QPL46271.1 glycosyltransferase family 4 protein [Halomonas sp. A40-4]